MRFTIAVMGLHAVHFPHLSDYPVRSLRDQTRYFPETFRERVVIAGVIEVARSLDPLLYQFHLSQFACDENSVTDRHEGLRFHFSMGTLLFRPVSNHREVEVDNAEIGR